MNERFLDTTMSRRRLMAGLLGTSAAMSVLRVNEFMGDNSRNEGGDDQDGVCDPIEVSPVKIYTINGQFAGMAMNDFYNPQKAKECFEDED